MPTKDPLYVERLILKDIRCFEHLEIKFAKPGESIVLIGDNGDGKSTVLRSLAMGICDQSSASALFRELHGEYVRAGSHNGVGTITIELARNGRERYRIETYIKSLKAFERFERVEQKVFQIRGKRKISLTQDSFPWHRIFASGYGPGIRVQGTSDYDYYLAVDAVYPLFRYDVLLQNPELMVRRLLDARRDSSGIEEILSMVKELLARVLQLDGPDRVFLEPNGLYIEGPSGKIGLSALADGFRGTVTWVLDVVAWWFLHRQAWRERSLSPLDVHGIVLIDEVEQHLHPRWQRSIMRLLADSLPHVQFIATTHSPLVASGCEGIPVHRLAQGTHDVVSPFGWLAEDVYEIMGLTSSRAKPFETDVLQDYARLDAKRLRSKLSRAEQRRLTELRRRLATLPGDDPIRLTMELENLAERAEELTEPQS